MTFKSDFNQQKLTMK